jgi:hypothetical protein
VRKVIALRVIHETVGGDRLQLLFQFIQIGGASDLTLVGQAEDEISEAELISENAPQIFQQRR